MSRCILIASDFPLYEVAPPREYPLHINLDTGTVFDGNADDNYFLLSLPEAADYTHKKYGVSLEWYYTEGRAMRLIGNIKDFLREADSVELWCVWLGDFFEFEDRPFIHRKKISIDELSPEHVREIDSAEIWNTPDKQYPERPSFYCLTITR